ncbi:MAG: flagellar assembly protein FliX [Alphaproteobacteria bacterium]|nr:flagellar assembly protein FliX [Alphaproteobacteria bacterium]
MKVEGPGRTQGSSGVKKSDKAKAGDEAFGSFMSSDAAPAAATTTTRSIAMVDSLLAAQAVEDPTARAAKKRARERSMSVLEELDKIRMAMLSGTLTVGHMVDIADVVASHRERITDPRLTSIMDEIDLRAQVELAKMRVALDAVRDADKKNCLNHPLIIYLSSFYGFRIVFPLEFV